jgi:hypothetical protein
MKLTITCKDPDGIGDSIAEAVKADVAKLEGLSEAERELVREDRLETTWAALGKWVGCPPAGVPRRERVRATRRRPRAKLQAAQLLAR